MNYNLVISILLGAIVMLLSGMSYFLKRTLDHNSKQHEIFFSKINDQKEICIGTHGLFNKRN